MTHTAIPKYELDVFESLKNIRVVFDVGARDDVDYLILKPNIKLHAFEPNPVFFQQLKDQIGDRKNVHLNNFGLGNVEGVFPYSEGSESIGPGDIKVRLRRLDDYVKEKRVKRIDFLKMDTEGYEWNILKGATKTIPICRYIQYETWNEPKNTLILEMLKKANFEIYYIGGRNNLCVRKGEVVPPIPAEPQEGGLIDKNESNRLH